MIKAGIISIGNEILIGKTINTNLSFISGELTNLGIYVSKSATIRDERIEIITTLENFSKEMDIIIMTGGLGPTKDDVTKKSLSDFFGKELVFVPALWEKIKKKYELRHVSIPKINKNQAELPKDFIALKNELGTASGLYYSIANQSIFSLPGVPYEMQAIFKKEIIPILKNKYKLSNFYQKTIHTYDITESKLAEILDQVEIPATLNLAFLPQIGGVDLRIYGYDFKKATESVNTIKTLIEPYIWGYDNDTIQELLQKKCVAKNLSLSLSESCTGGLVQKLITEIPGSSQYFKGGLVSYSNEIKSNILGVKNSTLERYGAVSKKTAIEMAEGCQKLFKTNISGSITGIAGPKGGTKEKPIGTVYMSVKINNQLFTENLTLQGSRRIIREKSANRLLFLIYNNI